MSNAHTRKKQPDLVRRSLLDHAAAIILRDGVAAVTVQAVAEAAGVTKGGLFHHFPSKQALIDGMFCDMLERLDKEINSLLSIDPSMPGCFTRAYVKTMLGNGELGLGSAWSTLGASMLLDPSLGQKWINWLQTRLQRHSDTDSSVNLEIVRLAADGVWISYVTAGEKSVDTAKIQQRLVEMTF